MFGRSIDYLILRPFTHSRNIATENELNEQANRGRLPDIDRGVLQLRHLFERLEGNLPLREDLRYLDIGCGDGDITIALTRFGVRDVTGIDYVERHITTATNAVEHLQLEGRVKFVCQDIHTWTAPHRYDVVISHGALEHISDPKAFLSRIVNLVEPGGVVILAFAGLFHSPFGDHMDGFFRIMMPWRGVLFSERAILRLRREKFRPTDPATCYQEIKGGLNLMRYSAFLQYVQEAGWEFSFLSINPQFKKILPLYYLSNALARIPVVRDYVVYSVYSVLHRRS